MVDVTVTKKMVECFKELHISGLDDDWAKEVWSRELVDFPDVGDEAEAELEQRAWLGDVLRDVLRLLSPWVHGHNADNAGFWTVLVENDINYRAVVALLAFIIAKGQTATCSVTKKKSSLLALRVYVNLIVIPGSAAFRLFHPMLFSRCVTGLKMWSTLGAVGKRKKASPKRKGGKSRSKPKRRAKDTQDEEEEGEEEVEEEEEITPGDMKALHKLIMELFQDVFTLLKCQSLSASPETADSLLDTLVQLTRVSPETYGAGYNEDEDFAEPRHPHVAALSYKAMLLLINDIHGDIPTLITQVFKRLLYPLLMMFSDKTIVSSQTIPQYIIRIRQHTLNFICHILSKFGQKSLTSARTLVQHMCIKVPDKTDYRTSAAEAICVVLKQLPNRHYVSILQWIQKLSKSAKPNYRGFSIDVVSSLLAEKERPYTVDQSAADCRVMSHLYLLEIILERCSDIAPTVRSRAISALAVCVSEPDGAIMTKLKTLFTPVPTNTKQSKIQQLMDEQQEKEKQREGAPAETPADAPDTESRRRTPVVPVAMPSAPQATPTVPQATPTVDGLTPTGVSLTPGTNLALSDCEGVVSMLRRRCVDDKVGVRKSAVQAMQQVICLQGASINKQNVECLSYRCRDAALSVRKQAMLSLTEILHLVPDNQLVQWYWMDGVLPLCMDRESTIQDKCLDILDDVLLSNITVYHRSNTARHHMAWRIVDILSSPRGQELRFHLKQGLVLMSQRKLLKPQLVQNLLSHVGKEDHDAGAWMLLAECSSSVAKLDTKVVTDYWNLEAKYATSVEKYATYERVLTVMGHICGELPADKCQIIIGDLQSRLGEFMSPPELIAISISTLFKLYSACETRKGEGIKLMTSWCTDLLKQSDTYLSSVIFNQNQDAAIDEERIICHLFTIGHVGHLCPNAAPKHILLLVQSLIAGPGVYLPKGQGDTSGSSQPDSQTYSQSQYTQSTHESQADSQRPDSQMSIVPTQVLTQFSGSKLSTRIRGHAFIAIGKLCLQNESVAKRCVAAMVRELDLSDDPVIRNNVMIILCDLCVRYTTLTDRYIAQIANCIRDQSPLVRKQTLTCIMSLLQEDYMKWRGSLLFKFLIALVDENETISQFAEFCFVHLLLGRHPGLFFQHFVEAIFYFNSYDNHPVYNKFQMSEKEKTNFSLKGAGHKSKRFHLYKFMLDNMTDAQRFNMMAKLSQDVLGGFTDEQMSLDAESQPILNDTLQILCSKEIKVSTLRARSDDADEEMDPTTAAVNTAKKNLVTQVVKKNVMENIVPMIITLKHMLETQRSPLLRDLMMFFRDLMKDYKNEIKDLLAADKQLASEIEFDLRKFDEEQREHCPPPMQPVMRIVPGTPRSLHQDTPGPHRQAAPVSSAPGTPRIALSTSRGAPGTPFRAPSPAQAVRVSSRGAPRQTGVVSPAARSPAPGTPPRNKHMELANLFNSAKKALQTVSKSPTPRAKDSLLTRTRDKNEETVPVMADNDDVTPEALRRAISTPDRTIVDITFQGEVSMIAPSPISPQRNTRRTNRQVARPRSGRPLEAIKENSYIICMASPNKPAPTPRHWNLKAALPPQALDDGDDVPEAAAEKVAPPKEETRTDENDPTVANVKPATMEGKKRVGRKKTSDVNKSMNDSMVRRSGRARNFLDK